MKRVASTLLALLCVCLLEAHASAAPWVEGKNYVLLTPAQHTRVPAGKVEVMEVFSYGCVYCNKFQPVIERLKRSLPANAQMVFLPAEFLPAENFPMFQRAYFAAESLGIAARTHQAFFDAVWGTRELAIVDGDRLKVPPPSLADAARWYERVTGVKSAAFLDAARSPAVEAKIKAANDQIKAMQIPGTPWLVVNGKYRIVMDSLQSDGDVIDIVNFLIAKESAAGSGTRAAGGP
jgi:protein dithiol oxidoreductase (disulfide-forming)